MTTATMPSPVSAPWVWTARELAAREDWIIRIGSEGLADIAAAIARVKAANLPLEKITAWDFALPSLARDLARARELLADGPGLCLLRGLPLDHYGRAETELLLWGIGTHVGHAVAQSYRGDVIGEVMDMTHTGDTRRAYRSPLALNLHIDSSDVVGLLSMRKAQSGGESLVASSFVIHNAILAERPDLMGLLYRGFYCRHSESESSGEAPTTGHRVPVFGAVGGRLVCNFHARPMLRSLAHDRLEDDPRAAEALEVFRSISVRDDIVHRMMLEPGDLQFLNNRVTLHGRTGFEDFPELERKRLLLRLWLAMPDWPPLPAGMLTH
jgi:hypothetical protein